MYKDYPINEKLFHWESQSVTKQVHTDGQNLIHHRERGYQIFLFVRINSEFEKLALQNNIEVIEACTLVMLSTNQY